VQPSDDASSEHLAPEKPVSILLIEILQALERRVAGLWRQVLEVLDFSSPDHGGQDVDDHLIPPDEGPAARIDVPGDDTSTAGIDLRLNLCLGFR
jgi:hypothetical protein